MTVGVPGWIRANLFSSPTDGIITIVLGAIVALAIFQSINWVFFTASWEAVTSREIPLYVIGRYPQELYWRPETTLLAGRRPARAWHGDSGADWPAGFAIGLIVVTLLAGTSPIRRRRPRRTKTRFPTSRSNPSTPQSISERRQRDISDADLRKRHRSNLRSPTSPALDTSRKPRRRRRPRRLLHLHTRRRRQEVRHRTLAARRQRRPHS